MDYEQYQLQSHASNGTLMTQSSVLETIKNYFLVTKPGIIFGNAITAAGGFALASRKGFPVWLFLATIAGLSLIVASACVVNNFIDRNIDEKMTRTKNRPLVTGRLGRHQAMRFAIVLGLLGTSLLVAFSNPLATGIALFGFFVYVIVYSFLKYHTAHGTLIGSVAGAIPPVVGYCSACNRIDFGALLLFLMIALWQMPHFFAIAIYRLEDYTKASIPILPITKGILATKVQILLYIIAFLLVSFLLTAFNYTGRVYLIATALLGIVWLCLCIRGFQCKNDQIWARKMFLFSLVIVTTLCSIIPFSS
jgi:protoheme IX farnesyltransferase